MIASPAIRAALVGYGYVRVRPAIVILCGILDPDRAPTRPIRYTSIGEAAATWIAELRGRP